MYLFDYNNAIRCYQLAIDSKEHIGDAYYNMALALNQTGLIIADIENYNEANKVVPPNFTTPLEYFRKG